MLNQPLKNSIENKLRRNPKAKFRKPPKALYPWSAERGYTRDLLAYIKQVEDIIYNNIMDSLPMIIASANLYRKNDGWVEDLDSIISRILLQITNISSQISDIATKRFYQTSDFEREQLNKQIRSVFSVDVFQEEPWLKDTLGSFATDNAALIQGATEETVKQIRIIVSNALQSGQTNEEIYSSIKDSLKGDKGRFKTLNSRVKLIARDQIGKLDGNLSMLRQTDLGFDSYIWSTVGDERVRSNHASKDGKVFYWNKPPVDTGHPGHDYQCRCIAEPNFDDVIEGVKGNL